MFPAVVCGVFTRWLNPWALLAGWAAGMVRAGREWRLRAGAEELGLSGAFCGWSLSDVCAAVPALALNLAVSAVLTVVLRAAKLGEGTDETDAAAYVG